MDKLDKLIKEIEALSKEIEALKEGQKVIFKAILERS